MEKEKSEGKSQDETGYSEKQLSQEVEIRAFKKTRVKEKNIIPKKGQLVHW